MTVIISAMLSGVPRVFHLINTEKIIAERKTFFLDLKQNARGKVVRITEKVSSNRDRIMVPAEILDDFIAALQDIRETLKQQGE